MTPMQSTERQFIGRADPYFTLADERNGYAETRRHLAGYTDVELTREYLAGMRHCFHDLFGHNARRFQNLVADELLARGISELPNMFGPITVTRRWSR